METTLDDKLALRRREERLVIMVPILCCGSGRDGGEKKI